MNASLTVAIITGLFGAVVAPILNYLLKMERLRRAVTYVGSVDRPPAVSSFLMAAIGGASGVFVGYFALAPVMAPTSARGAHVTILIPSATSLVPRATIVQGTEAGVPTDHDLWLLVLPSGTTQYHPQPGPLRVSADGRWAASTYVGRDGPNDVGREFVIVAALAEHNGTEQLRAYLQKAARDNQYPGVDPLPSSVRPAAEVTVIRK